jgi:hypothetical protein
VGDLFLLRCAGHLEDPVALPRLDHLSAQLYVGLGLTDGVGQVERLKVGHSSYLR